MLAAGASLLVAASVAGSASSGTAAPTKLKTGGTFKWSSTTDVDHIDPSLAYGTLSWAFEYATSLKLVNYPDASGAKGSRLVPEGSLPVKISRNGKVYTFRIRPGFRFSDGSKVTARNYAYAITRQLNKDQQGSFAQFVTDKFATNIVGGAAATSGKTNKVSGVSVKGNTLTVRLVNPSGQFLTQLATPFFQAIHTKLPLGKEVVTVSGNDLPSAGPYYVSSRTPRRGVVLSRNKFYKGKRPHRVSEINYSIVGTVQTGFNLVTANQIDRGTIPPAEVAGVAKQYGVNKGRFQVRPRACTQYTAMNTASGLFKNNVQLRKAFSYAINRKAQLAQSGPYAGTVWSHLLPKGFPGSLNRQVYPLARPNLTQAKKLAKGHTRNGKANYWYTSDSPASVNSLEIDRQTLKALGISLETKAFRGFDIYDAAGVRGADYDIAQVGGWCQDYPDPYDFLNVLLDGSGIQSENNVNLAYLNNGSVNKKLRAAAKLVGKKRLDAYGKLDINIFKTVAPLAVISTSNTRSLFSNRVNPKSLTYLGVYNDWDLAAIALK